MIKLSSVASLLGSLALVACGDGEPDPAIDHDRQEIRGGDADLSYPAVCVMQIQPPPVDGGTPPEPIVCTGTLVGERVVLTTARCVQRNVEAEGKLGDIDLRFGISFQGGTRSAVVDAEIYRYFDEATGAQHDLALLLLEAPPTGVNPVTVNATPLTSDLVGQPVDLVGFGAELDGGTTGTRIKGTTNVDSVNARTILAGDSGDGGVTTCKGDSGAPAFRNGVMIAMTETTGSCNHTVNRIRTDLYAAEFIFAYVDRFDGDCRADGECVEVGCRTPDPDCDASGCAWDGTCAEACPTRDWDCDLGTFAGDACVQSGECELGGGCVPADDAPDFLYCSQACEVDRDCPTSRGMTCVDVGGGDKECRYGVPSEGSQGYACSSGAQCRSGICEDLICVFECDPGAADACPEPYLCGPSDVAPGKNVCLGEDLDGGGGFCAVGGGVAERRRGGGSGWLVWLIAGLGLAGLRARQRTTA
jgi:V8-like Glu-specific endopeptidase